VAEDPVGVGVAEADGVDEVVGDELGVGELVAGEADGDVEGVGVVADGEVDGERAGVAGAELPRAGPTRFGVCAGGWPVIPARPACRRTGRNKAADPSGAATIPASSIA